MSIFAASQLAVSLPAAELGGLPLSGSVMPAAEVAALNLSRGLRCAVALVEAQCRAAGIATIYLARPEIFAAPGPGAAWLRQKLGAATEHLCISDGSTVKPVEGCRTHIFMYRMSYADSYASFRRLCRRAPGLMAQVASQVNTHLAWGSEAGRCAPPPVYLTAAAPPPPPEGAEYAFQFRPYLPEETARRILESGPVPAGPTWAEPTRYIPLTETALADPAFARAVALRIRAAFIEGWPLLLRLPAERPGGTLAGGIAAVLAALADTGVVLPRHRADKIRFLTADPAASAGLEIFLHESFDFWRHARSFYESARAVTVGASQATRQAPEFLPQDVTQIFGPQAARLWLTPPESRKDVLF